MKDVVQGRLARNAADMIRTGQGWSGHRVKREDGPPSLPLLVALQVRQDPAGRKEDTQEAGGEPNGDILHRAQGRRNPPE